MYTWWCNKEIIIGQRSESVEVEVLGTGCAYLGLQNSGWKTKFHIIIIKNRMNSSSAATGWGVCAGLSNPQSAEQNVNTWSSHDSQASVALTCGQLPFPAAVFVLIFKHTKASFNSLAWKRVQIRVQGSRYDETRVWFMNNADMDNQRGRFSGLNRSSTIDNNKDAWKLLLKEQKTNKKTPLSGKRWQRREHRRRGRADVLLPRRSAQQLRVCAHCGKRRCCFSVTGSQTIRSSVLICFNVQSTVRCIFCVKSAM